MVNREWGMGTASAAIDAGKLSGGDTLFPAGIRSEALPV
jgi:hypothetical protein